MKLFYFRLHELNGEQEYSYDQVVNAMNLDEAQEKAETYASNFYGGCDEIDDNKELDEKTFWFLGGCIAIHISDLWETTKEEFLERVWEISLTA